MNFKIISISGNIASGKSTLIENLKKKFSNNEIVFIPEPIDEWKKFNCENGQDLFINFYKDKLNYSFMFQLYAMVSRFNVLDNCVKNNPNTKIFVMERSCFDDRYIFAQTLYENGYIKQDQLKMIDEFINITFSRVYKIDHYIFIDTEIEKNVERLMNRNRTGENEISLKYLDDLKQKTINFESMIPVEKKTILKANCELNTLDYSNFLNSIFVLFEKFLN